MTTLTFVVAALLSLVVVVADKNPAAYSKKLLVFKRGKALLLPANRRPECFTIDFVAKATTSQEENGKYNRLTADYSGHVDEFYSVFVSAHYERFEALRAAMEPSAEQQTSRETSASDYSERRRRRSVPIGIATTAAEFTVATKGSLSEVNRTFANLERRAVLFEKLQSGVDDAMLRMDLFEFYHTLKENTHQMVALVREFLKSTILDSPLINRTSVVEAIHQYMPSMLVSLLDYAYDSAIIEVEPTTFPALRVRICVPQELVKERVGDAQLIFHVGSFLDRPVRTNTRIFSRLSVPPFFVALPGRRISVNQDENCRKGVRGLWVCTEPETNERCNISTFHGCLMQNQDLSHGSLVRYLEGVAVIAVPSPMMASKHCDGKTTPTQIQINDTFFIDLPSDCSLIVDGKSIRSRHGAALNIRIDYENESLIIGTSVIEKIINSLDRNKSVRISVDGANIVDVLTDASSQSWWDRLWEDLEIKKIVIIVIVVVVVVAGVVLLVVVVLVKFPIGKAIRYVWLWLAQFATSLGFTSRLSRGNTYRPQTQLSSPTNQSNEIEMHSLEAEEQGQGGEIERDPE